MKFLVLFVISTLGSYANGSALEATNCTGNCATPMYVAGVVNKPILDLGDALRNDSSINGSLRVASNNTQTPTRLPSVHIRRGRSSLSGGYISPCKILTAKHGIITALDRTTNGTEVMISSETDINGNAINHRAAEIMELGEKAGDLIILSDPNCEGGRIGFFRFMRLPPTEGKTRDFASMLASFPYAEKSGFFSETLAVTKCNSKYYREGVLFHDCFAPPGSSGGFLADVASVLKGNRHHLLNVNVFLARGIHLEQRQTGTRDDCNDSTCNTAIDGGTVATIISDIVKQDIKDYSTRMLTPQNRGER